jgi:hypothetical protein
MTGVARRDPALEMAEVTASGLGDEDLAFVVHALDEWADRMGGPIGCFASLLADQLRSVQNWRAGTLAEMEARLDQMPGPWV